MMRKLWRLKKKAAIRGEQPLTEADLQYLRELQHLKDEANREIKKMLLTDQGLDEIGEIAVEKHNVNLMFLVQILKGLREIKALLKEYQCSCNKSGAAK